MLDLSHLGWPFFNDQHRQFALALRSLSEQPVSQHIDHTDVERSCRSLLRTWGEAGWLRAVVPARYGGQSNSVDVQTPCLAREILSWDDSLAPCGSKKVLVAGGMMKAHDIGRFQAVE